ncbi:ectonucleoside triphosphate diphosphohydrolase 6 isoform X2 [Tiliqua scincoides]|uniref:ectonucleoside triphosphate diphosphohydrolase 6 isoform X2 n=1 Tax=Tiliqua scincoides TaxID=71010 RepID=UPI003461B26C
MDNSCLKWKKKESPRLLHETFRALKPGLSAYADNVDKSAQAINELLALAKDSIAEELWKTTPLVLKATAGLRLLPGKKAQELLSKVKEIFQASPFLVRDDCVSIMDGTDEGISAWITVNFLTGCLNNPQKRCEGILDLGGGSTQITFHSNIEANLQNSSVGHITPLQMFNTTYQLYSHSYLGLGLMSARLAILGGAEGEVLKEGEELTSPCLPPHWQSEWEHNKITYKIKGQKAERTIYESCSDEVAQVLKKKIRKTDEVKDFHFYAFSYYYDLAVKAGLIENEEGGTVSISDFENTAEHVCEVIETDQAAKHPFLCMDLIYVSLLLQELGFPKSHVLKLTQKINTTEASWALGATLHYLDSIHKLQY